MGQNIFGVIGSESENPLSKFTRRSFIMDRHREANLFQTGGFMEPRRLCKHLTGHRVDNDSYLHGCEPGCGRLMKAKSKHLLD